MKFKTLKIFKILLRRMLRIYLIHNILFKKMIKRKDKMRIIKCIKSILKRKKYQSYFKIQLMKNLRWILKTINNISKF